MNRSQDLLQAREQRLPATLEPDFFQITLQVENSLRQRLLVGEGIEHPMLDSSSGDQVDHRDRASLVLAPRACDPLLQTGRVPWQIAVDDHAGALEVQTGAAGIRAEKNAAFRIVLEQ